MSNTASQYPDFSGLTFEKVWAMFQETDKKFQETDRKFQEARAQVLSEASRIQKEAHEHMEEIRTQIKETERIQKENSEQIKKTEKIVAQTNKQFGHIVNRFGEVIEHLIIPAAIPRFNELGFHFDDAAQNHKVIDSETGETLTELDILMENGDSMVVVEIKTKPSLADVEDHIERLQIFRAHKNRKKIKDDRKIYGAIAAVVCPDNVKKAALKAGFYVLLQGGDTIKIDVPKDFVPTAF